MRGRYDMVVAMYHDQGHIPLKLLSFYDGVNITAGLPFYSDLCRSAPHLISHGREKQNLRAWRIDQTGNATGIIPDMKGQHRLDLIVAYAERNHTLVTVEQLVEAVDASQPTYPVALVIKLDESRA